MNTPKLRFKEFNDEYKSYKFYDVAKLYRGSSPRPIVNFITKSEDSVNWIKIGDVSPNETYINSTSEKITKEGAKKSRRVYKGEIILSNSMSFGRPYILNLDGCIHDGWFVVRDYEKLLNKKYLYHFMSSPLIQKQYKTLSAGGVVSNISSELVYSVKLNIPSKEEQHKVAKFLSLLDKKIELQTKKIEDLKLFKKGLINKLFENTSLKEVHINDLGTIVTGTTPSKSNNKYWDNGNIVWVTPSDINENRDINNSLFKITEKGLKHGRFIPKDSILVTCIASIGKNAILKVDGTCNQQINAIIPNKNYNSNYIYYLMNSISNYMKSIAGTSATSIINKEEFSKITIKVHRKDQQDYIDKILSKFETKLLLENDNLVKLQELKKGLMQNMFV